MSRSGRLLRASSGRTTPGAYLPEYANPLDRWLVGPLLKLVPQRVQRRMEARSSIDDVVAPLDVSGCVPGLPEWQAIPTPGHTPGHTAFFRSRDRVLIAGDAVLTVDVNNLRGLVTGRAQLSAPPRIATWDWDLALDSVAVLATREPSVLVGGHGAPIAVGVADSLDALGGR